MVYVSGRVDVWSTGVTRVRRTRNKEVDGQTLLPGLTCVQVSRASFSLIDHTVMRCASFL
jgi:hypothetical protein